MTGTRVPRSSLPLQRFNVLDISPRYDVLRSEAPVTRVLTPTGDPAWVVTAYKEAREVFGDSARFAFYMHAGSGERVCPLRCCGAFDTSRIGGLRA